MVSRKVVFYSRSSFGEHHLFTKVKRQKANAKPQNSPYTIPHSTNTNTHRANDETWYYRDY